MIGGALKEVFHADFLATSHLGEWHFGHWTGLPLIRLCHECPHRLHLLIAMNNTLALMMMIINNYFQ